MATDWARNLPGQSVELVCELRLDLEVGRTVFCHREGSAFFLDRALDDGVFPCSGSIVLAGVSDAIHSGGNDEPFAKGFCFLSRFLPVWYSGCLGLLGMRAMLKLFAANILAGAGGGAVRGGHCRLCERCRMRNGVPNRARSLKAGSSVAGAWSDASFLGGLVGPSGLEIREAADFLGVAEPLVGLALLVSVSGGNDEFSEVRESVGGCGSVWAVWPGRRRIGRLFWKST